MARGTMVKVRGEAVEGLTPEEQKLAQKAMDDAPGLGISKRGGTDIPVTETDPDTIKQREGEKKLVKKQEEFVQKQMDKTIHDNQGGQAPPLPQVVSEADTAGWKPVRLIKGYIPMKAYKVMEGETFRIHTAQLNRVLDKVQAGSTIYLPQDEARQLVTAKLAERADEF